ncbi:thiamine pyrophosphate-dependent enzyme [Fervidibacillus halotolerans]|uniref:Thiamine pyrophosphate-binding protein n=1 Tax=Fervidibacillus halotolerans TaxID=2980027 RepID=A0A9E8M2P6_9BACI|nr:thiamine pyrophosphate-dependent enzyme [Fervidibacillus halotolerans]WAA13481.1 thiamine pyrophosphate-binding protein [Fervidibacillus halotolerans]
MKQKINGAKAVVECLKIEGVSKVFTVPGESFLPILDALYDEKKIQVISARHEGGAAFMAEGYAKASLKPGVVFATRGVGATNLSIGVHTAKQDSTPMIIFIGQVHSKFLGREGFQEIDIPRLFQPIAKWTVEIQDPERIPELVQRGFRIAQSGRPGPVVISLPEDVLKKEGVMNFAPKMMRPKPKPSSDELKEIKSWMERAKRPVIIAGGGVKQAKAETVLVQVAETFSFPVFASFRRHDVFPNNHPLYVGHMGIGMGKEVIQTVQEADLIFALGTRLSEITTNDYQLITHDKTLIHIDIEYDTIGKSFPPTLGILSDIKEGLKELLHIDFPKSVPWKEWALLKGRRYQESVRQQFFEQSSIYKQVIDVLRNNLPKNTIITNDAGNFAGWLHQFYPFEKPQTYIGPTSGAMGYGLPAAIGAKIATPQRTVVSLSGDGGFFMTFQELETAVRYEIPIISLVFNNEMYGTIRMHQEIEYPNRPIGTDLGNISFIDLAKSVGANGYRAKNRVEFEQALHLALRNLRPSVIEIITGKEQISVHHTLTKLQNK